MSSLESKMPIQNASIQSISPPITDKASGKQQTETISNKAQTEVMGKSAQKTEGTSGTDGLGKVFSKGKMPQGEKSQRASTCKHVSTSLHRNLKTKSPVATEVTGAGPPIKATSSAATEVKATEATVATPEVKPPLTKLEQGIKLLSNMRAPDASKNETLKSLQDQNINTPQDVLNGYLSVMTTKELFTSLAAAYSKATPEKKQELQDFAKSWLNSKMYNSELNSDETQEGIQAFLKECLKDTGTTDGQKLSQDFSEATKAEVSKQPQEVPRGYSSTLSTKELFASLARDYPKATPERKQEFQDFAKSWLNSKKHNHELTNQKTQKSIQAFLKECSKDTGTRYTNGQRLSHNFLEATKAEANKPPQGEVSKIPSFDLGKDPKKIANEFRSLYSNMQAKITAHDVATAYLNEPDNKAVIASRINNSLGFYINNDILSSSTKKEAVEKYKMYLKVAEEALNSGDIATVVLLYTVLHGTSLTSVIKPEDLTSKSIFSKVGRDYPNILKRLEDVMDPDGSNYRPFKRFQEMNRSTPTSIELTFSKELTMANEGNKETILGDNQYKGEFNEGRIRVFGQEIGKFHNRKENMKNTFKGEVNLEKFLFENPKNNDANIFYRRRVEIKEKGWNPKPPKPETTKPPKPETA